MINSNKRLTTEVDYLAGLSGGNNKATLDIDSGHSKVWDDVLTTLINNFQPEMYVPSNYSSWFTVQFQNTQYVITSEGELRVIKKDGNHESCHLMPSRKTALAWSMIHKILIRIERDYRNTVAEKLLQGLL